LLGQHFGGFAHHHFRQRTEEAVAIHAVDQFLIAQTISPARFEIIRKARHGFCAAGENATGIAEQNGLIGQRNRLDPRGASFVHGEGGNFLRNAAANGNLPRGIRAAAGLAGIAEDGFLDLLRLHSGALDGGFGGNHAHVSGGERRQRSAELADGRAHRGENIDSLQSHASKRLSLAGRGVSKISLTWSIEWM
jgi:hypothetical protein